jgi:hypothetical protein
MIRAPVSHWSDAVVLHLSTLFPQVISSLNLHDTRVPQSGISFETLIQHPLTVRYRVRSIGSHQCSLSANGYDPLPRFVDQHSNVPYVDPPRCRALDHLIILQTCDGYGDLSSFIQRFESIADHC